MANTTYINGWMIANYGGQDVVATNMAAVALLSNTKLELYDCHKVPFDVYVAMVAKGTACGQQFNTKTPWQVWCGY